MNEITKAMTLTDVENKYLIESQNYNNYYKKDRNIRISTKFIKSFLDSNNMLKSKYKITFVLNNEELANQIKKAKNIYDVLLLIDDRYKEVITEKIKKLEEELKFFQTLQSKINKQ
jgi:hypothetical protein